MDTFRDSLALESILDEASIKKLATPRQGLAYYMSNRPVLSGASTNAYTMVKAKALKRVQDFIEEWAIVEPLPPSPPSSHISVVTSPPSSHAPSSYIEFELPDQGDCSSDGDYEVGSELEGFDKLESDRPDELGSDRLEGPGEPEGIEGSFEAPTKVPSPADLRSMTQAVTGIERWMQGSRSHAVVLWCLEGLKADKVEWYFLPYVEDPTNGRILAVHTMYSYTISPTPCTRCIFHHLLCLIPAGEGGSCTGCLPLKKAPCSLLPGPPLKPMPLPTPPLPLPFVLMPT